MYEINLISVTDQAVDDIVAEIQIDTSDEDIAFDAFINRNTQHINAIVSEHRQQHR